MYRIELRPGEETALRTIDELAVGIRNGVITSRARIWHNAGQKWLPIEFHPHYRAALQQLETGPADDSPSAFVVAPTKPAAATAFPEPSATTAPESPSAAVEPTVPAVRPDASRHRALFRSMGLLAIGGLVIAGARIVTSTAAFGAASAEAESGATMHATRAPATDSSAAAVPAAAAQGPAPVPTVTPLATQRTIAGGGVVRGPLQAPTPAPAAPSRQITVDTIPSAPPAPALDLTLPSALPAVGKPPVPTNATAPSTDSLAR